MRDFQYDTQPRLSEGEHEPEERGPTPGKRTLTSELGPSRQAIARAVIAMLRGDGQRDANGVAPGADQAVERAASDAGAPLPAAVGERFARSLHADLSAVRVHTGVASAEAAHALGARAFALGQDIHFGAEQYRPTSPDGEALLAHEVAHTVQQGAVAAAPQGKLEVSTPGDHAEVEADQAAAAMVRGQPAQVVTASHVTARAVVMRSEPGAGAPAGAAAGASFAGVSGKVELAEFKTFEVPLGPLKAEGKVNIDAGYSFGDAKESGAATEVSAGGVNNPGKDSAGLQVEVKHKVGQLMEGLDADVNGAIELTTDGIKVGAGLTMSSSLGAAKVSFDPVHLELLSWQRGKAPEIATASVSATIALPVAETEIDGKKAKLEIVVKVAVELHPDWGKIAVWLGEKALEVLGAEVLIAGGMIAAGAAAIANAFISMANKYDAADLVDGAKIRALNYEEGFRAALEGTPAPEGPGVAEGTAAGEAWVASQSMLIELGGEGALESVLKRRSVAGSWRKAWPQCRALAIQKWKEDHSDSGLDWNIFMATLDSAGRRDSRDPRSFGPGRSWD